jgi:hypothetical protein
MDDALSGALSARRFLYAETRHVPEQKRAPRRAGNTSAQFWQATTLPRRVRSSRLTSEESTASASVDVEPRRFM